MTTKAITPNQKRITNHLNLVTPIAASYAYKTGEDIDDLIQVGRLGLIRAAQLFDSHRGEAFSAFARPHIRGSILHYLRDSIGLVKIPRRIQEMAQGLIQQERNCTDITRFNTSSDQHLAIQSYRYRKSWTSLEDLHQEPRSGGSTGNEWEALTHSEHQQTLNKCWKKLSSEEQECVRSVVIEGLSLRKAANQLGMSTMTVHRRVKQGLRALAANWNHQGMTN